MSLSTPSEPEQLITENLDIWTAAIQNKASTGRGSSKKQELYGIKKLRELIVELAVRGLLVSQDKSDEPASTLLEDIQQELKSVLGKDKLPKLKRDKSVVEPKEYHYQIPYGWIWCELQDVALFVNGKAHEQYVLENGEYVLVNSKFVSNSGDEKIRKYVSERLTPLEKGDIAIVMSDVPNGRALARCYLVECDDLYTLNQRIGGLKTGEKLNKNFFRLLLDRNSYLLDYDDGKKQANLKKVQVLSTPIVLPPEAEQPRIVAKVDELMALCDQLEQQTESSLNAHQTLVETLLKALLDAAQSRGNASAFGLSWQRIADHFDVLFTTEHSIDQLKQTILQLAVMGKLVPQNPNDEPASELLEKIAAEKERLVKEGKIKKQKKLPPISVEEKPFELPEGWEWCNLNQLISLMDAGWSPACPPEPSPNDETWGVLKTTAVQTLQYLAHENKTLSESKDPRPQYEVKKGDLLITRAGPKNRVGISCLVEETRPKLMISDKIIRFHLVEVGIEERFIALCLNAGATASYLETCKSGMAESQMNISQDKLKAAPIPLCPINESIKIMNRVDELMSISDSLKARIIESQNTQLYLADAMAGEALRNT